MVRFEKNDLDGAIADFTQAIELNGTQQEFLYYFRGMAHYRKGNSEQAIADLSKAITLKAHPRFYEDRGNLFAKQGELDRAIADLNKAIEIQPQGAKVYGDRGLVRIMRGEEKDAELDFQKCFELDKSLESQFRAAANQIRQRATARMQQEKPTDIVVIKFSWSEAPSRVLVVPSSPAVPVSTRGVSASGTQVLGDPTAKDTPNPAEVLDPSGAGRGSKPDSRDVMNYKFNVSIRNAGSKTIVAVKWAYFLDPKEMSHEGFAYLFVTKTNLAPGKEKTLTDDVLGGPIKVPAKKSQALFKERIEILGLEYSDGSFWQSASKVGDPQKTQPPK